MTWWGRIIPTLFLIGAHLALIAAVNAIHFQYFPVAVVLYDALLDVLIATAIMVALYVSVLRRKLPLSGLEAGLCLITGLLAGINYAVGVPTVIDRSLSIYLLEKIDQRGGGIRRDAFESVFKDEYMTEHRLVDIRLTEQINSGTIRIRDGCVELTERGKRIVSFTRYFRTNWLPRRREIMGTYSDALTDPFRNSKSNVSYRCGVSR